MFATPEQLSWYETAFTMDVKSAKQEEERRTFLKIVFDKVDSDGNGSLSKVELMKAMNSESKEDLIACLGKNFFYMYNQVDFNKDGGIDFDEFVSWVNMVREQAESLKQEKTVKSFLQALFNDIDRNNSGELTLGELSAELRGQNAKAVTKALGENFLPLMEKIDYDQDHAVNFVEFCDWVDLVFRKNEEEISRKYGKDAEPEEEESYGAEVEATDPVHEAVAAVETAAEEEEAGEAQEEAPAADEKAAEETPAAEEEKAE